MPGIGGRGRRTGRKLERQLAGSKLHRAEARQGVPNKPPATRTALCVLMLTRVCLCVHIHTLKKDKLMFVVQVVNWGLYAGNR